MKHQAILSKEKGCLFCDIVSGKKVEAKVFEDKDFVVVRDAKPSAPVHLLIIPREHLGLMGGDLERRAEVLGGIFALARDMAKKFKIGGSYKLVANAGHAATENPDHLHVHFIGGWRSPTEVRHV